MIIRLTFFGSGFLHQYALAFEKDVSIPDISRAAPCLTGEYLALIPAVYQDLGFPLARYHSLRNL